MGLNGETVTLRRTSRWNYFYYMFALINKTRFFSEKGIILKELGSQSQVIPAEVLGRETDILEENTLCFLSVFLTICFLLSLLLFYKKLRKAGSPYLSISLPLCFAFKQRSESSKA